jgi:4-aminobutyrate aminotransferase-like enzyme
MATKTATIVSTASASTKVSAYAEHVNPQWVTLLNLLDMNVEYLRCTGCELFTKDGRRILDYLSGYCVHNPGHNHPYIIHALQEELDKRGPAMLQRHVPEIAGELAERLCRLAGGELKKFISGAVEVKELRQRSNLRARQRAGRESYTRRAVSTG